MTQTFSQIAIQLEMNADAALADELSMDTFGIRKTRGTGSVSMRKSPWRERSVGGKVETHKHCENPFSVVPHKGFLPDVKLPYPLPPEPVAIADMANMFGVTHRTLHFYEEKAILSSRRSGLMRIYSHRDVHRMAVVNLFREVGIPVAIIQDVMAKLEAATSQDEADDIFHTMLETRKRELTSEISTVRRQIQQISDLMSPDDEDEASEDGADDEGVELTEQERTCLKLMAEGYASVRLTRTLGISQGELQSLEAGLLQKFSANNRFQAVAKAVVMGVIKD